MKVSIIIPIYNAQQYIEETLRSLLAQTLQDYEVLLVDDHGKDQSIEVAKALVGDDRRFRFLATPVNAGPGVARNVGIEAARGEYIAFIDSDDQWHPDFLKALVEQAEAVPSSADGQGHGHSSADGQTQGCDLTYCQLAYRGGDRDGQEHRNPLLEPGQFSPEQKKHFLLHFVTFSVCFLFRREFLLANDLRFPGLRNSEDTNFLIRCLLVARTIACVDQPLYYYCLQGESLSTGHDRNKYKQRLASAKALMQSYRSMCCDSRWTDLHLSQYRWVMYIIYLKKGLAQALLDIVRNL